MMKYLKGLKRLPKVLRPIERITLISALIVIVVAALLGWKQITDSWIVKPLRGGIYTEGIIAATPQDIDLIIAKLTKIGLTYYDHKGKIQGALAERWDISEDGKKYTFHLRESANINDALEAYSSLPTWQNVQVTAEEGNKLVVTLKQPLGPFLSFTSDPVVEAGPFTVEKQTKTELILAANPRFILGEPNLQKLIVNFYPDEKLLKAALQRQEIMAADQPIKNVAGTSIKKLKLTKQTALLFNLDRPTFKDKAIRDKVKKNEKLDQPIDVTLVTTQEPELLATANEFASKVRKNNVNISIKSVNPIALERDYVIKDEYDLILTSLHYGYDPDPYPYWHSSQLIAPGKNYAGYNNKDGDKLIEQARQMVNDADRQKVYDSFYKTLEENSVGIFYPNQVFEYTMSNRIKGVSDGIGAVPTDRYTEVWKWFLKAKKSNN